MVAEGPFPGSICKFPAREDRYHCRLIAVWVIVISERVFAFHDFHGVTADANVKNLVALFFGAGKDLTGTLHLHALLNVDPLAGLRRSIANHPGDGAPRS